MDELIAFLNARLDEDEKVAQTAAGPKARYTSWYVAEHHGYDEPMGEIRQGTLRQPGALGSFMMRPIPTAQGDHIARHDPARVLADVDSKRAILRALITQLLDDPEDETARWMVQTLALSYADHPDYREAWRPA